MTQAIVQDKYRSKEVAIYETRMPNNIGQLAIHLVTQWGMVQGERSTEDSSGRAGISLMPVKETVARAFDMAQETFRVAEERGCMFDIPDLAEVNKRDDA